MHVLRRFSVGLAAAALIALSIGPGVALADTVEHGIGFTKGCTSPTKIGDPYTCSYTVRNVLDGAEDTLTINSLSDTVHAASGDVTLATILGSAQVTTTTTPTGAIPSGATCVAASGNGVFPTPYTGVTGCTLPFGSRVNVLSFSHYTVAPGDFALPGNNLRDDASLGWHDTCDASFAAVPKITNCDPNPPNVGASSLSLITQLGSSTATAIHNAAHAVVTTVAAGSTVHDFVTVTGQPGSPVPTGNVTIDWFTNNTCAGAPAATSGSVGPLNATGHFDATGFAQGPLAAGLYGFKAHYAGDPTYTGSDGLCEPLTVVDANIQITPNGVNRVGATHTFTATVNVNDGTGSALAPDNTHVTFTIDSDTAVSTPNPPAACDTVGGSCTTSITSAVTGVTVVSAHTTVTVGGVSLTRATDTTHGSSGPATKTWVNAKISITPDAFNAVGANHTFTVTLLKDPGTGVFVAAAGEHVDFTLTNSSGATHSTPTGTCTNTGVNTNASGECTITFTSLTAGTVTGHATSTLSVAGSATFTVSTDGTGGNSGDATKVFQDANIQITPNGTNPVGATHTFTAHVNANLGGGAGFVSAPDGTQISFTIDSGPGAFTTASPCTTSGGTGSCTIDLSSAVTGVTTVSAHVTFTTPDGVTLTRSTNGVGANSGPAVKTWVNANIAITPATAANPVGTNHVLTITVNALGGTIDAGPHTATASIVSGPGSFVGSPSCTYTGGAATASCTVTITSAVTGTTVISATSDIPVSSVTITRSTGTAVNTAAGGSGNASKVWVDANIAITPATAANPVGTNHVLTITVNALGGTIDAGPHTATASIVSGPGSFVGSPSCTYTGGAATASCTVTITSAVTGTTVISATSDIPVSSVTITRSTGTAVNTAAGGSGNANKTWSDDTVRTDILNASNTVVTTGSVGDVVHDRVEVAKAAGTDASVPNPTGNVIFHRYATANCTGASTDETVALTQGSPSTAISGTFTVAGDLCYQAEYLGDANYPAHTGAIEPLTVTTTPPCPAGSFTFSLNAAGDLVIKYDQFPAPNDNSYGVNAVGWGTKGHTFGNLVGSDHAGFSLIDTSGVVKLDFNIDYISAKTGTPSGYASLGPFGGDGSVNVGTLTPADITYDSSLARNLNDTGYFVGGVQTAATKAVADLLVNSPPTLNTVDNYTLTSAAAAVFTAPNTDSADSPGWNFHDTYFVTISVAKLALLGFDIATWTVAPNADELHNSPAKPCPCPTNAVDPNPTISVVNNANGTTTITYAQSLAVNDNSYGTGTDATWGKTGHTFSNLTGSDKLQVVIAQGGVTKYNFILDYISAKTGTLSGYGSLGPTGGDGSTTVSQGAGSISNWSTSLDVNMNGPCFGLGTWTTNSPTSPLAPECPAWNFVNSYTVTVNGTFTAAEVTFPLVHNSPSKPSICPTTGGSQCNLSVTKTEVKDKQLKITIKNSATTDAFLTAINNFIWPAANGKLLEIKLDGDSIYKPAGGTTVQPLNLTTAQLVADQNKRKINHGSSDTLIFIFEKNASSNLSLYSGATASFGANCVVNILP